jgi:hypothetical protein
MASVNCSSEKAPHSSMFHFPFGKARPSWPLGVHWSLRSPKAFSTGGGIGTVRSRLTDLVIPVGALPDLEFLRVEIGRH